MLMIVSDRGLFRDSEGIRKTSVTMADGSVDMRTQDKSGVTDGTENIKVSKRLSVLNVIATACIILQRTLTCNNMRMGWMSDCISDTAVCATETTSLRP
jgi:hypothetical protein